MKHRILKSNPFFQVNRKLVEREINSSVTVTFMSEVDLTAIETMRKAMGQERPSYTAFVAKAVAIALQKHPYANRRVCKRFPWGTRMQQFEDSDVAIAAERAIPEAEGVAFVDVMRNVQDMPLEEVTHWLKELSKADETTNAQWRDFSKITNSMPGWLASLLISLPVKLPGAWHKYRGGSVLISSPAKYGVDAVVATWPWPVGVSFGLVKDRPMVVEGNIESRRTFTLVLNFDRRIMAGAPAAKFFKCMVDLLEDPQSMVQSQQQSEAGSTMHPSSETRTMSAVA